MRHFGKLVLGALIVSLLADAALAQPPTGPADPTQWPVGPAGIEPDRGPGWYFSLWKMLLPVLVFCAWMSAADWLSQDCQRLKLGWQKWNGLVVGTFMTCFLLHYIAPGGIWVGFPLLLAGTLPIFMYVKKRNRATTEEDRVLTKTHLRRYAAEKLAPLGIKIKVEAQTAQSPLEIMALGGANPGEEKAVSMRLATIPGCDQAKKLLTDALEKRVGQVLLDYTQQAVAVKYQIDGVFQDAPARDRASGDAMLNVLKTATFLNPAERVKRQTGKFDLKLDKTKYQAKFTSQGTPTGERVLIQIDDGAPFRSRLDTLGMRQKMQDDLKEILATKAGFVLVSAPPGRGLTTLLNATATGVDRFVRSVVCVESSKTNEMRVENVVLHRFDPDKGESPATVLPTVFRTYPDAYIMPDLVDAKTTELLCNEVTDEQRFVLAAIGAREAAEAMLRVLMLKVPIKTFVPVVTAVVCGKLVRKLCDDCKQPFAPPPQLLQQLRLPAGKVQQLYRQFQPPPVEPGKKPAPPCAKCNGLGYLGRTGIYELIVVNNDVRNALAKAPTLESVRQAAQKAGMHTFQEEAIALLVQGVTSLEEISRALKE
ncbi:MAG: Flp pilus assembly complex ATPase component TadA [Planctomycetaceae bacterium]|nr:Flp pilus assembly complex ATPase component TadA [Planctomycetaceae bacterium]